MQATKIIAIEIPESLYRQFISIVTKEGGVWRNRRKQQTFNEAVKSAFVASLIHFLRNLEGKSRLPEFRDYMLEKYPEIDDDLVIMIEDLIKREREKAAYSVLKINETSVNVPDFFKSVK